MDTTKKIQEIKQRQRMLVQAKDLLEHTHRVQLDKINREYLNTLAEIELLHAGLEIDMVKEGMQVFKKYSSDASKVFKETFTLSNLLAFKYVLDNIDIIAKILTHRSDFAVILK